MDGASLLRLAILPAIAAVVYFSFHFQSSILATHSTLFLSTCPFTATSTHTASTIVKLDPRDTPPPLHFSPVSEQERSSTAETTPIGTPTTFDSTFRRRSDKDRERERERERDPLSSCYRKPFGFAGNTSSYVDSALLESDFEDTTFPLFQDASASEPPMDACTTSMKIATAPNPLTSSRRHHTPNLTSNLTSALQSTSGNETWPTPAMNISNGNASQNGLSHRDSLTGGLAASGSLHGSGVQPIHMSNANRERPRRESLAGSMVSGMSWGAVSVGSWVRDEMIMQGSSPFPQQSPSFHSSSYIPKLEANFMKDFFCCGKVMASLHELLQHFEEIHAHTLSQRNNANETATLPDTKAAIATSTAKAVRQSAQQEQAAQQTNPIPSNQTTVASQVPSNPVTPKVQKAQPVATTEYTTSQHHPSLDMDAVQDMEMDDVDYVSVAKPAAQSTWGMQNQARLTQRPQFGQPASRVPPLDTNALNLGNHLQHHEGLRHSTPTTPVAASRNGNFYHNNPTVSSVNTPTLIAHPRQQQQYIDTPDSSAPGTPGELENDFVGTYDAIDGTMNMSANQGLTQNHYGGFENFNFGNGNEMLDLCIDEPAKRLFSANGVYSNNNSNGANAAMSNAARLGDAQYSENSELARTIREQQRLAGIPEGGSGPNDGIAKPFHCPVIGCEKAYKNQNGLKYHKALHANDNGTFSIVDPETLNPYPGTIGMEKHKPYRCDACGKRYKNLNGLKYHKNHSATCQDSKQLMESVETSSAAQPNPLLGSDTQTSAQHGTYVDNLTTSNTTDGYPGASLPDIDEEMIM
ncbi:MAG: hypothetical protein Q9219_005850 [cf. Caloplaca sp. 3 TL-2023]